MRKIKEAFEEGHLNTEAEAMQMGIDALRSGLHSNTPNTLKALDCISRQTAIDAVQGIKRLATLPDNDAVIRMSAAEYVLFNMPSAQPEPQSPCDLCVHNPPSSMDGKPCCMCVAEPWRGEENGTG